MYADVMLNHANDKQWTFAAVAKPRLFELRHLIAGKVAPDIAGEDLDGKTLKLADYRGKVVVINFWGTWCPPCMAMIPKERALVKRFADRPFALLGVANDYDRERIKTTAARKGITWRSWWDGGAGPLRTDRRDVARCQLAAFLHPRPPRRHTPHRR